MTELLAANLLPQRFSAARRRRRRAFAALVAAGAYLVTISLASVAALAWSNARPFAAGDENAIASELARTRQVLQADQLSLSNVEHQLAAIRLLRDQPDLSLLMQVIAQQVDSEVVIREFRLEPTEPKATASHKLILRGVARTYSGASALVLRLEQLQLFNEVKLEESDREPVGRTEAIRFRIQGTLGARGSK